MWGLLNIIAGSKLARTAGLVLAVILTSLATIQYFQWQERDRVLKEVQKEDLKNYKDTRERIDDANNTVLDTVNDALEWLRGRQPN